MLTLNSSSQPVRDVPVTSEKISNLLLRNGSVIADYFNNNGNTNSTYIRVLNITAFIFNINNKKEKTKVTRIDNTGKMTKIMRTEDGEEVIKTNIAMTKEAFNIEKKLFYNIMSEDDYERRDW